MSDSYPKATKENVKKSLEGAGWAHLALHHDFHLDTLAVAVPESKSDPDYAQPDLSMLEVLGSDEAADKREGVRPGHGSTVVLSCNASANNIGDEGVEGMARAFLLAGAAAIVGTLVVRRRHEYISAHGADVPAPRGGLHCAAGAAPRHAQPRPPPGDRPACVRTECGRRAAGGLEAANALGRLSCVHVLNSPPPPT